MSRNYYGRKRGAQLPSGVHHLSLYYGAANRCQFYYGRDTKGRISALLPRQNTFVTKLLLWDSAFVRRSALFSLGCTITMTHSVCCARVHFCTFVRRNPLFFARMHNYYEKLRLLRKSALLHVSSTFAPLCVGTHFFPSNPQLLWQSAHLHTETHVCAPLFY